jgi:hypothetical protein
MSEKQSSAVANPNNRHSPASDLTRRHVLGLLAGLGVGTATFQRALAAEAGTTVEITPDVVRQAEWIAGIELAEDDRKAVTEAVKRDQQKLDELLKAPVGYEVPPALVFYAAPPQMAGAAVRHDDVHPLESAAPQRPGDDEDLAFMPVTELAALLRTRQLTSVELTRLYIGRLKRFNELVNCVVTLTEDVAIKQAERADREIAAGHYRGPLHGIPWGAKDLISWPGYKTTWGADVFKEQSLDVKATVAKRLEDAGAVLVAKLTLGALAQGDEWFGGLTRNPWNPDEDRAARRPVRRRPWRRAWSRLPSAAKRWAASSRLAAAVASPACVQPSVASAAMAA